MSINLNLWLLFNLTIAAFMMLLCAPSAAVAVKKSCGSTNDCAFYKKPICALDKKKICFRWFNSPCHMDIYACEHNKDYEIYHDSYCELDNFMCDDEFDIYEEHYEENENLDKIIYSIYDNKTVDN